MAEAIAALSLVATIVQLVDFGTKVLKRLKDYQSDCKTLPESFSQIYTQLPLLLQILITTKQEIESGKSIIALESALSPVIEGCRAQVELLNQILSEVVRSPQDSRLVKAKKAVLSLKTESAVSTIHSRVDSYISTLTFYYAWSSSRYKIEDLVGSVRRWLSVADPSLMFQKALRQRQAPTGQWFLTSNPYQSWKTESASIKWLYGAPGCGKTILAASIIQDLKNDGENDPGKVCIYHFFDFNDKVKQKPLNMIKSFINQLLDRVVVVPEDLKWMKYHNSKPCETELVDVLRRMIVSLPTVYLIIDALDECDHDRQTELTNLLALIVGWNINHLHIMVTSQKVQSIETGLDVIVQPSDSVQIHNSDVDNDIAMYISARLETDKKFRRWINDMEVQNTIKSTLMDYADGKFRWIACQLEDLATCVNRAMVKRSLANLPQTLDDTYDRILLSIEDAYKPYALQILRWLTFSRVPLTVAQIGEVTGFVDDSRPCFDEDSILPDPRDVLTLCKSLVTVVEFGKMQFEDSIVRLAHSSVRDYLVSDRLPQSGHAAFYSLAVKQSEALLAKQCLAYLILFGTECDNQTDTSLPRSQAKDFRLATYSLFEWNHHARAAAPDLSVDKSALEFMAHPSAFHRSYMQFDKSMSRARDIGIVLKEASILGCTGVVRLIFDSASQEQGVTEHSSSHMTGIVPKPRETVLLNEYFGTDVDLDDSRLLHAVDNAAKHDHRDILEILFVRTAHSKWAAHTALERGVEVGNLELVKWLVESKGANIEEPFRNISGNALQAASSRNYDILTSYLVESGANIDSCGHFGTALMQATEKGHKKVCELLLTRGANVEAQGPHGTALQVAAKWSQKAMVVLLISHGANVNSPAGPQGNALQLAASNSVEMVLLLIDAGADLHAVGPRGNALQVAADAGQQSVVAALIDEGAAVDAPGPRSTALELAIEASRFNRRVDIIKMLLKGGAKVNASGPGGTALHCAVRNGVGVEIVQLLIDNGATIDAPSAKGTPLQLLARARAESDVAVAKLLIERGAELHATESGSPSAFTIAMRSGISNKKMANLFFEEDRKRLGRHFSFQTNS